MQGTQILISGIIPNDKKIELFADQNSKKVFFIQNGKTQPFTQINKVAKENLLEMFMADDVAITDLQHLPINEALEQYVYHCFGATDCDTDVYEDGTIGNVELNSCTADCMCSKWKSKKVQINGNVLTARELQIIQFLATDYADKQVAQLLNISQSTLDTHKANIMRKMDVHGKTGIITQAIKLNLIQL